MSTEPTVRVGDFALRHRVALGAVWLLVLLLGGAVAVAGLGRLDQSFTASGGPGHRANQAIQERYGNGAAVAPLVAVASWPAATDVRTAETAGRFADAVRRAAGPGARTVSFAGTGDEGFLGADGRTVYALVYPGAGKPDLAGLAAVEAAAGTLRAGLRSALPAARVEVTGVLPLQHDSAVAGPGPAVLAVKAGCALGLLVLLVLAFRSPLGVAAPLLLAGVTSVGALVLVEAVAGFTEISFIVVYLVPVTALVLAVHRWAQPPGTAGRSAVAAGAAGAAACAVLAVFPAAFLRSIGVAGLAVWVVGTAASLTLTPVLRSLATRRTRPSRPSPTAPTAVTARTAGAAGTARGRGGRRPRAVPAAVGLALLVLLAGAATQLRVGNPEAHALVAAGPARDGLDRLSAAGVPSGVLNPLEVLVPAGMDAEAVAARAARVPGVLLAAAPAAADWRRDGSAVVVVVPEEEPMTAAGAATVTALRSALSGGTAAIPVGGSGVVDRDLVDGVYRLLPFAVPAAALAAFLALAALTTAGTAARAVSGALLAAVAAAGALTVLWQWGPPGTGAVTGWVPLVVGAFAFCVSLDRSAASAAGGPGWAGPVAAGAGALAVLAVGIGPQVELALLVSGFAMAALFDALAGGHRTPPGSAARPTYRSSFQLV
ncbi:RND superfamily putative drug exporter [Streptomyces sp. PvR006]|uniref:MMPL family transporter n=1 Tax=Streptomyces sp. PvR006 TaxID=2817860 RepID=UPI001AE12F49|nr:MMPL family transporter [Streptomyces sp. PvR006]MBP2584620.1 RND superfamily putative drug exporter [Streptomyces sp. PvR006]